MTNSAIALEPPNLLVELLDREFGANSLAALVGGAAKDIPWRLWRQALYAPLHQFLQRPGREFRAAFLTTCWHLEGRKDEPPPELPLVVEILHAGSLIIDDIEDQSLERRGGPALHRTFGVPTALNAGNWLYFWAFRLLDGIEMSPEARAASHSLVTRALLECHHGQALDLSVRLSDLEQAEVPGVVRSVTALKTGGLVGLAAGLGALASGADRATVDAAIRFGRELGAGLQMLDDLSGILNEERHHKGREDLTLGRPTWPWAWLSLALDGEAFRALQGALREVVNGESPEALAREIEELLAPHGRRRVHTFLEQAFTRFAGAVPHGPALVTLRLELERLERSYG